jgi:hypothetical protein
MAKQLLIPPNRNNILLVFLRGLFSIDRVSKKWPMRGILAGLEIINGLFHYLFWWSEETLDWLLPCATRLYSTYL